VLVVLLEEIVPVTVVVDVAVDVTMLEVDVEPLVVLVDMVIEPVEVDEL